MFSVLPSLDKKIALYLNDGSNDFTEQTISNNADGAGSVFAADVDSDGDMDVLSASRGGGR
ncbi:VCBS repeat-containing protein [Trichodesmium erythraeum 21-75]|nr:VCBS repeat-containing protein [Trichodesmium erythraeum 21-75]